jgi:serine protease
MLAVEPSLGPNQIESILESTAIDRGPSGKDPQYGHGLINAAAAVLQASGGGPIDPVLSLGSEEVTFDAGEEQRDVPVFNVGGGVLQVDPPSVSTQSGGDWLTATRVTAGAGGNADTAAIRIVVDRSGLADGLYSGTVGVTSNGGDTQIAVALLVQPDTAGEDVDIFILAVDADTFETVAEVVVNPTTTLDYGFADLPPGDYVVFGGSDDDNDGIICGEGDVYCGAWPSLAQPEIVTVTEGEPLSGIDFTVTSGFTGLGTGSRTGVRRL